jgi:hypothetical protein
MNSNNTAVRVMTDRQSHNFYKCLTQIEVTLEEYIDFMAFANKEDIEQRLQLLTPRKE